MEIMGHIDGGGGGVGVGAMSSIGAVPPGARGPLPTGGLRYLGHRDTKMSRRCGHKLWPHKNESWWNNKLGFFFFFFSKPESHSFIFLLLTSLQVKEGFIPWSKKKKRKSRKKKKN